MSDETRDRLLTEALELIAFANEGGPEETPKVLDFHDRCRAWLKETRAFLTSPTPPTERAEPLHAALKALADEPLAPITDFPGTLEAGLFVVGEHPTCPACESLVLPDGKCVNGCHSTPPKGTAP